jgi:signal transduction histidine kinase
VPNSVQITVSDTGPGIAPEFHQEIFDDFVSLRHPDTEPRGTGLGLAIARRLVLAQQGKIWVESEVNAGSRFRFLLPLQPLSS